MFGYIINFGVYTMAMVGIIIAALFVYKKSNVFGGTSKSTLKIDDKISLNARKSLYVVNAGGERFLIAGDMDNTSLIAKLGQKENIDISTVTNPIKYDNTTTEIVSEVTERKPFVSHESTGVKLPEFRPEINISNLEKTENNVEINSNFKGDFKSFLKKDYTDADKALDKAFNNIDAIKFDRYLDVKSIRKKPVMKELARKLAQI